jgi:small subunit ribosomal protein S6
LIEETNLASNVYECMVILDPNKYAQDPNGIGSQIPNLIGKFGGEVLVSRLWQEQKLAYPIDGHKKGTYWLTYFRLDSGKLVELNREVQINETILRCLTLRVDPRLVEALVEHAKGGQKAKPPAEPAPAVETIAVPEEASI